MRNVWLGSRLAIKDEEIKAIVKLVYNQAISTIANSSDYVDKHNAYTAYTAVLLLNATGHRPVDDPFCHRRDYDLDIGMMLIDDKAMSEQHRYRLIALPDIAIEQLIEYEKHLKWLVCHLIGEGISSGLQNAVYHLTNKTIFCNKQPLPLFFFLTRENNSITTYSVTEKSLEEHLDVNIWELPLNFPRHNIATNLRLIRALQQVGGLTTAAIESHLGHMEGINHPFGTSSTMSPASYQQQTNDALNNLLIEQGWEVLRAKRYYKQLETLQPGHWIHSSRLLGPYARQKRREDQKSKDREIVRTALDKYSVERIIADPTLLDDIRDEVITLSSDDEERITRRLLMLWRYFLALKRKEPKIKLPRRFHIISKEPSPFKADTLYKYGNANAIRQNFISYLQSEGGKYAKDTKKKIPFYRRVAEIIISAALFDAITDTQRLMALSRTRLALHQEGDITYLDIIDNSEGAKGALLWRWLPQTLSISLVSGLNNSKFTSDRPSVFKDERVNSALSLLLSSIGCEMTNNSNPFGILAGIAQDYWIIHLPPFLREIANGNSPMQPVPETTLVRLLRDERLEDNSDLDCRVTHKIKTHETTIPIHVLPHSHRKKYAEQFLSDLTIDIKRAKELHGKKKGSPNRIRKRALARRIRSRLKPGHNYPSVAVALSSWAIKLCTQGTDLYGTIKFSTVSEYTIMIAKALLKIAYNQYFVHLEPDQYDYLYELAIEINSHADQKKFFNNIKDFHNHLSNEGLTPHIDWAAFSDNTSIRRSTPSVSANIITPTEYENALGILLRQGDNRSLDRRTAFRYAALLICGYRFGLRISEAFHLQYRDIQHTEDWSFIVLHIKNMFLDDTKSNAGRRQIPLIGNSSFGVQIRPFCTAT